MIACSLVCEMEQDDLGPSWRHLEAVGVLPGCHPPGQHGGRDPESDFGDFFAYHFSRRLAERRAEGLGLVIESPVLEAYLNLSLILKCCKSLELRFIV